MLASPLAYRNIWNRKPTLRAVYRDIYRRILSQCGSGPILEIGGGSGNFKSVEPGCVSTDVVSAPWLDAVCDAQQLPFADASFGNIVMMDVLHHLESPLVFFKEAARVLAPGGRLIFCDPAITPFSSIFYRLFHEEPFDLSVNPLAIETLTRGRHPWESNQGIPTLLVGRHREALRRAVPSLTFVSVDYFAFLAYPLSGGFKRWAMLPAAAVKPLCDAEWRARKLLGRLTAFRLLAVFEKRQTP